MNNKENTYCLGCRSENDLYFLSFFGGFESDIVDNNYRPLFEFGNREDKELSEVREFFGLNDLVNDTDDDLTKMFKLIEHAYKVLHFEGQDLKEKRYDKYTPQQIIDQAHKDRSRLNCRYIALIYTQMALSIGLVARFVSCLPMDLRFTECHCVTEIYIRKLKKWVGSDAAFGVHYYDKAGIPLNLQEMRQMMVNGIMPRLHVKDAAEKIFLTKYWIKNIFRFRYLKNNCYNALGLNTVEWYGLNPRGFFQCNEDYLTDDCRHVIKNFNCDRLFYNEFGGNEQ